MTPKCLNEYLGLLRRGYKVAMDDHPDTMPPRYRVSVFFEYPDRQVFFLVAAAWDMLLSVAMEKAADIVERFEQEAKILI